MVNNPAYEEQCSDTDATASSRDRSTELSAQYSNLGPAYYESIRDINQRAMMTVGDIGDGKGSNKRLVRHTEPMNCPRTYYHEVHTDALRQWPHRVVPSDSHSYSRLHHC